MLTKARRRPDFALWLADKSHRRFDLPIAALAWMFAAGKEVHRFQMGVASQVRDIVHTRGRHIRLAQHVEQLLGREVHEMSLDAGHEIVVVEEPAAIVVDPLILQLLRLADGLKQRHPAVIHIGCDRDPAILRADRLTRGVDLALIVIGADRRIKGGFVEMLFQKEARNAFEHGHFDMNRFACPVPVVERGQRCIHGMQA